MSRVAASLVDVFNTGLPMEIAPHGARAEIWIIQLERREPHRLCGFIRPVNVPTPQLGKPC